MLRPTTNERGPLRVPSQTWTWVGVIAALVLVALGGQLGRWVGFALVLAVGPTLARPLLRLPLIADNRERIARWVPVLVVVALATALLGDLALGRPPASRDHGIHYFQTKVLVDELIPRGELIGFSDRLNTGYPFGDSYPVLGYLITGAANLLSFGLISLRTSYAWGLLGIWVLALGAVWWLASTIARELRGEAIEQAPAKPDKDKDKDKDKDSEPPRPALAELLDPRWAGALAAIAWLIDPGASREGGWNYLMFHGVWPQLLSSALWIASLPATWAALRRPSMRSLALAGLLLGASVLAHPFGMLTAATSAAAWPIVLWATGTMRKLPGGQIRWWLLIHVFAGLVCLGWVLSFLASAGAMARSPVPWKPLGELATSLLAGELFWQYRAWVGPLSVVGLIVAIRRGRAMAWLGVGLVCALLVLGSEASITVVRLDLLVSSFKNLQFPRYSIALKPVLYAFAGVGGAVLLARLRAIPNRDHPASDAAAPRPAAGRLLAALCLAPLLVGIVDDRGRLTPRPVGGVEVLEGSPHAAVEQALSETLVEEAQLLASANDPRPLNVAFLRRIMGGGTYPLFAITDADANLVLDGHIPAVNYKYQVRRRSPDALRLLGVTHVIYDHPLTHGSDDIRLAEALEPVGEFGVWKLGRLRPDTAKEPKPVDHVVIGQLGQVEVTRESVTKLSVSVGSVEGAGRVDLPLGPYRKWSAVRDDGKRFKLEPVALARGLPGVKLPFKRPGTVTLEYRTPTIERAAMWISNVAILLLLGLMFSNRELQLAVRLQSPRALKISWALGLLGVAGILVGGYVRQQQRLEDTWTKIAKDHMSSKRLAGGRKLKFRSDLVDDGGYAVTRSTTDGCDGTLGKDAMAGCTSVDARPRRSMSFRAPYLYRCLRVQVPGRGSLEIHLDGLEAEDDLAGFFVRENRTFEGLSVRLPGEPDFYSPVGTSKREHFHLTAEGRAGATTIELRNDQSRDQAVCFSLAALERVD
ncbi:hypothetical protein DB30_08074 [Enhygromyxa salina]|uniref:Uncharacterized protein n=1 Tax=Enhygromyxa salina TaxID=215803 RepID=A0A0C2CZY5_9BACT|nr:hypothetical protein [Enhygromyxa salina]KIG13447.1 hypothetical protein DB30_08074 [Enhygromyxa salina]